MKRIVYGVFSGVRCDRVLWGAARKRLRILAYHGVCGDHVAAEPWVPPFFVTRSAFEQQIRYLQRHARVLPLAEAIDRLENDSLPDFAVSVTFDDGYANNLHMAYPVLKRFGVPATIFLATAYPASGDLFPFDRLTLVNAVSRGRARRGDAGRQPVVDYASHPLDLVLDRVAPWWEETRATLSDEQIETLRPLRPTEIKAFDPDLIEFGAHTHTHCILRNEEPGRRQTEIVESIRRTAALAGRSARLFSFPNGGRGDFSELDKATVRAAGVAAAVSTISGTNGRHCDRFALSRYSIGLSHTSSSFAAEVTGFRSAMMSLVGRT